MRTCEKCGSGKLTQTVPKVKEGARVVTVHYECRCGHSFEVESIPRTDFELRERRQRERAAETAQRARLAREAGARGYQARSTTDRELAAPRDVEAGESVSTADGEMDSEASAGDLLRPDPPRPGAQPLGDFARVVSTPEGPELIPLYPQRSDLGPMGEILKRPEVEEALALARSRGGIIARIPGLK